MLRFQYIREYLKPFTYGIFWGGLVGFALWKLNVKNGDILKELSSVLINYSLAMTAFAVTAFTLMQFLHEKEWFEKIQKTEVFSSFLHLFKFSIAYHMALVGFAMLIVIIRYSYTCIPIWALAPIPVFLIATSISLLYRIVKMLLRLYQK